MASPSVTFGGARSDACLQQIVDLQHANLPQTLGPEEAGKEGFVSLTHTVPLLREMNTPHPHRVARQGDAVVGYALVMQREMRDKIPDLWPMFDRLAESDLRERGYVVMGQLCVAKGVRGQGVVAGLYDDMAAALAPHFDCIVTEIAAANPRSLRAHEKAHFTELERYVAPDGSTWVIVVRDLATGTR